LGWGKKFTTSARIAIHRKSFRIAILQKEAARTNIFQLSLIHPQLYLRTASAATKLRQEIKDALALKYPRISLKK
jgi:hypothetical protein